MGQSRKLRILIGCLKDKASIIKATLSTKRNTSKIHRAILRATTHDACYPPSDKRVSAILSLGHGPRPAASTCIEGLMDRLHGTHDDATVALKCLFIIHNIITKGSFILKDQLSIYPSCGGYNFLNLSTFRDDLDPETWELSSWVRWYAGILEQNLMVSRVLGYSLCSSSFSSIKNDKDQDEEKLLALLNLDLLKEIDFLVGYVEQICNAPDSLHLRSNSLVYEVVRLVGEDYGLIQREIFLRVVETGERMVSLNLGELTQLQTALNKFEDCKERLRLLFVNRKKNDVLWDLISETKMKVLAAMNEKREEKRLVLMKRDESSELTPFRERFAQSGQLFRLPSGGSGWLGLDRVPLTASTVG